MGAHFATQLTPGGYLAGEVSSALQKSIRRGLEREAPYCATELDLAGFGNYVFKRLRIIAREDVEPADSMVAVQVRSLYENWLEARKR
jgi:replication-associated recombination protein RarA